MTAHLWFWKAEQAATKIQNQKPNKTCASKMTTGFKLSLISILLCLLVYLLMKWDVCKLNVWISQAPNTTWESGKKCSIMCSKKHKKDSHFKIQLLLFSLSTRAPAVPIKYTNIFSFSHMRNVWHMQRKF